MQEGKLRPSQSAEVTAEAELDAAENAVPDVAAEILASRNLYRTVRGEEPDNSFRSQLHTHRKAEAQPHGHDDGTAQHGNGSLGLSGADVLGAQCRHGGQHGGGNQEDEAHDLLHDANGRRVRQTSLVRKNRDQHEGHLNEAVLQRHRNADFQKLVQHRRQGTEILPPHRQHFPLQNNEQSRCYADGLGHGGAQRRTGRSHMHGAHEEIVQRDVAGTGQCNEVHGTLAVTLAPEDGAQHIVGGNEGNAQKADPEILPGSRHGLRRGGHNRHDGTHQKEEQCRQHHSNAGEQKGGIADGLTGLPLPFAANCLPDADRGAHRKAHQHDRQHMHHLGADGNRRRGGHTVELSDDKKIRHSVQSLQEIGEKIRKGKKYHAPPDTSLCQILFHTVHMILPPYGIFFLVYTMTFYFA